MKEGRGGTRVFELRGRREKKRAGPGHSYFLMFHIETCSLGSGFGPPKTEKETLREEKEFPQSTGPEKTRTSEQQQHQQQQPLRPSLSFSKDNPCRSMRRWQQGLREEDSPPERRAPCGHRDRSSPPERRAPCGDRDR